MSLETITLIIILTLLAICLGASFFWIFVIETIIHSTSEPTVFEVIASIRSQATRLMSVIFAAIFICAITLNAISHSRSEPYLLKIGLISFVLSLVSILSKFVFLERIAIADKLPLIDNLLLWFNLLCIIVSYWSFLHYALNPKI
ncbi:MAG: hypothetical protein QNJ72_11530 [Pleurocapsa sp. MO_226.B13]|nr:hypothetical protein [Pleurocapsa sp. MO_226.B13]